MRVVVINLKKSIENTSRFDWGGRGNGGGTWLPFFFFKREIWSEKNLKRNQITRVGIGFRAVSVLESIGPRAVVFGRRRQRLAHAVPTFKTFRKRKREREREYVMKNRSRNEFPSDRTFKSTAP